MKRSAGLIAPLLLFISVNAQDAVVRKLQAETLRTLKKEFPDTIQRSWITGGVYSVNVGQGSLSNWAAGGDDFSLSIATSLNLFAFHKKNRNSWDNTLDVNFGYINTTSLGGRKNDDRFDLLSKYGYSLGPKLNLTTLFNFRSQLLKGYKYQEVEKDITVRNFASAFLAPAYVVTSQGLDYKPTKELSVFVSPITSRWVIVNDDTLSARGEYGVVPGETSINQLGAFATIHYQKSFNKYVSYKGRIDIFSNYKRNPQNADLYMTNTLSARVAKIIAFSWNVDMIYDDDAELFGENGMSPALQLKSIIGVGLQVRI
ncbi:MAG TPA: DUF3078 domain-containing protein [Chitinophagaceae bacterium]